MLVHFLLALNCAAALLGAAIGLRERRYALVVCCAFAVFYYCIRPLMLVSDTYLSFALLHGDARNFEVSMLTPVVLFLSLCFLSFTIAYWIARRPVKQSLMQPRHYHVVLLIGSSAAAIVFLASGTIENLAWFSGAALIAPCMLLTTPGRRVARVGRIAVALLLVICMLLVTEERRDWAVALLVLAFAGFSASSRSYVTNALALAILVAIGLFVAIWMRTPDAAAIADVLVRLGPDKILAVAEIELDFALVFDDIVLLFEKVPRHADFLYGETFTKPLVAMVPRELWPSKPETLSRQFTYLFNRPFYDIGGSEPLSLIGEMYWNFGWFGWLPVALLGLAAGRIDAGTVPRRLGGVASTILGNDRAFLATRVVLASMLFYFLRGPLDTVWLALAVFFVMIVTCQFLASRAPGYPDRHASDA